MLGKIPMVENRNNMVIFSHHHQIQILCQHLQLRNHDFNRVLLEILTLTSSSRVSAVRFRDSSGRFLPQSDSHQSVHDESENSPRVRNEPGSSSRDGQPIRVDAPDHAVIPGDVEIQGEEVEVGANDENPNFQRVPDHPSDDLMLNHSRPNPLSHDCHIHEDESLLNSLRETCARDSQHRVFLLFLLVKLLWHSVRIAWILLVCRKTMEKRLVSK